MVRRRTPLIYLTCCFIVIFLCLYNSSKSYNNGDLIQAKNHQLYDEYKCGCPRIGGDIYDDVNASLCSDWSTSRGPGQNVVSYTLYGNMSDQILYKKYYNQLEDRLQEVNKLYQGWILRLYHNFTINDTSSIDLICRLYCKYPHFDPCEIKNIYPIKNKKSIEMKTTLKYNDDYHKYSKYFQETMKGKSLQLYRVPLKDNNKSSQIKLRKNLTKNNENNFNDIEQENIKQELKFDPYKGFLKEDTEILTSNLSWRENALRMRTKGKSFEHLLIAKMWRYLPMADPVVNYFLIRDVDSAILKREVSAVNQWIQNSTAAVHAMRDHPSHNGFILAGMWGGCRDRGNVLLTDLLQQMLRWPPRDLWDYDQTMLRRIVWPEVRDHILIHDSYHCINPYLRSKHRPIPFPTQRRGKYFVSWGPLRNPEMDYIIPCPIECRPPQHTDWILC